MLSPHAAALTTSLRRGVSVDLEILPSPRHLGAAGATVIAQPFEQQTGAYTTVEEIIAAGGNATAIHDDFLKPEDIARTAPPSSILHTGF